MTTSCCSQFPEVLMEHSDTTLLRTSNGHDSATIGTLDFSEPSLLGKSMDTETHPAVEETQYYKQLSSKDVSLLSNIAFSKQRTVSQNRATLIIRMFVKELQRLAQNLDVIPTLNTFGMNSDGHCEPATLADRPMCRICHDGGGQEELLSPCECAGTLGTIHRSCLEHWLSASSTSFCELCHFQFSVQRKARPLLEWLRNPGLRQEKRTLFGDMVCFLLITPLATISGWLCLRGAVDHLQFSSRLEAVGLIALTVALFTIYLFWTLVSLRYHCRLYNEWRQTNQRVVLLLPKSHSESIGNASVMGLLNAKRPSKETIV